MDNDKIAKFTWYGVSDYQDKNNPKTRGWLLPKNDFELVRNNIYLNVKIIVNIDGITAQTIVLGEYVGRKRRLKIKQPYLTCDPTSDNPYSMFIGKEPVFKRGHIRVNFLFDNDIIYNSVNMNIFTKA